MTKQRLVIVSSSPTAPGAVALRKAAQDLGYEASIAVIGEHDVTKMLHRADRAIFRIGPKTYDTYKTLVKDIPPLHTRAVQQILLAFDKAEMSRVFTEHGIAAPETRVLKSDDAPGSYPVVVKILRGNQGIGVELVHNEDEYHRFALQQSSQTKFVAQEFIAEAGKQDKRLLIADEQCIAAMRRRSTSEDFRANLHTGGVAEAYTPTDDEIELAIRATRAFGLSFAGVDIIDSIRGPLVLEINPSPGLAIGDVTGIDVATKIIKGVMK